MEEDFIYKKYFINKMEEDFMEDVEYDLIYLEDEARDFINNTPIYFYQGNTKINIVDYFPLLKQGYTKQYMLDEFENYYNAKDIQYPIDFDMMYITDIADINDNLNNPVFMKMIQNECDILRNILVIASTPDEQTLIKLMFGGKERIMLLLADPKVKLYVAIYKQKKELVDIFLNEIDPRIDSNEAYRLAKFMGNKPIIEAVKNKIIQLNMLYDMVLQTQLVGYEQIGQDIRLSKYV